MNKKVIIGNFKMNFLPNEVVTYIENLKKDVKDNNKIILCVPYVDIPYASNILNNTNIFVGAQNMHSKEEGPYTGEISVKMLKSIKTDYVLLGHYERRLYFNETEEEINKKLILALKYNIKPVICIGSTNSLENEINMILKDIKKENIKDIIFIYEPVTSIGTGKVLSTNEIISNINLVKQIICKKYNEEFNDLILGYGGSININNVIDIVNNDEINAILVGSSSLDEKLFSQIINKI